MSQAKLEGESKSQFARVQSVEQDLDGETERVAHRQGGGEVLDEAGEEFNRRDLAAEQEGEADPDLPEGERAGGPKGQEGEGGADEE